MADLKGDTVTWCNRSARGFVKELQEGIGAVAGFFSSLNQVFVPREMLLQLALVEGQSVRYAARDQVATRVEPLTKAARS